jgi:hypothetical protein
MLRSQAVTPYKKSYPHENRWLQTVSVTGKNLATPESEWSNIYD